MKFILRFLFKISFLTFITFPAVLFADTIVSFTDLHFHSDMEKEEFLKINDGSEPDYFALFLSANKEITKDDCNQYKERINSILIPFQKKSFKKLKEKKKISKVYDRVQDQLMDKYIEEALYSDLFSKGEYQCVTSSMLFTRVFEQLNIPYEIEVEPRHVYLIAYPQTSKIIVQTTNPKKGVFIYESGFKNNFIEYMRKNKLISKDEYENKSVDDLFTEYYLKTEVADLKVLASIQYSNIAIQKLRDSKITESFHNMLKAYYLNPDNKSRFLFALTLGMQMDKMGASDEQYTNYYVMLYKLTKNNLNKDLMVAVFNLITDKQLNTKNNIDQYNKSYNFITQNITDSALINEISFIYNKELGIRYLNESRPEKAYPYVMKAFSFQPENSRVQNLLVRLLIQRGGTSNLNTKEFLAFCDSTFELYNNFKPLQQNSIFTNLLYRMELQLAGFYYYTGNAAKGLEYKTRFENLVNNTNIDLTYETKLTIERDYSSISVYYFKHNNVGKAKAVIKQALKYYPDSYILQKRYKALF